MALDRPAGKRAADGTRAGPRIDDMPYRRDISRVRSFARRGGDGRRGFTLLESMFAATVLGIIVLAVFAAVTSSQRISFEGQKRLLAAMAADDLMIELSTLPYHELRLRDGLSQAPGAMQTLDGAPYTDAFWAVGRRAAVTETTIDAGMDVRVRGLRVVVTVEDDSAELATVEMFVPEPAA